MKIRRRRRASVALFDDDGDNHFISCRFSTDSGTDNGNDHLDDDDRPVLVACRDGPTTDDDVWLGSRREG